MLPVAALWHPPLTGPSRGIPPFSDTSFPILLTSASSVVLISSQILSLLIPLRIPFGPSITSLHISGEGRQVIIKSTPSVSSLEFSAIFAPFFLNSSVKLLSKSLTVRSNLFLSKLPANLPPTFPNPIKPIFMCVLISKLIIF